MSTRCQIGIYESKKTPLKNWNVLLYRHSDGYPDDVVPMLKKFLTFWKKERGLDDTEYCGARLLQYLCNEYDNEGSDGATKDLTGILGYGISNTIHGDIEYFYRIYPDILEVYEAYGTDIQNFKLIKTVTIS